MGCLLPACFFLIANVQFAIKKPKFWFLALHSVFPLFDPFDAVAHRYHFEQN